MKRRVLILCTGNSCRSQMAEGFWRQLGGRQWDVHSAGLAPQGVNPLAIKAMAEVGIDISDRKSQALDEFLSQPFDLVVTVCANAEQNCPHFPNARRRERWAFDDPAAAGGSDEERMGVFRRVRDEIAAAVRQAPAGRSPLTHMIHGPRRHKEMFSMSFPVQISQSWHPALHRCKRYGPLGQLKLRNSPNSVSWCIRVFVANEPSAGWALPTILSP